MNYQSSGSYHTLTHWQSGKTRRKWPEYYYGSGSNLIPPMLINGNIALFPYGSRVKGYEYFTTGEDYSDELKDYQAINYLSEGQQKIPVKPVYGEICKADWTLAGTTDQYYYVCIYYSPFKLDIEPLPLYYKKWSEDDGNLIFYETNKVRGENDGQEIDIWMKNDKKHELHIDKNYTGTAIIPEIECRPSMVTGYYNDINKIPEWQRKFCKDRTDLTYQASPPDEIPEVTERVKKEVKKKHPEYFKYPLKLGEYGTPLYLASVDRGYPYEFEPYMINLDIRYLESEDEQTTYLNRANRIGKSYNRDEFGGMLWGEDNFGFHIYAFPEIEGLNVAYDIVGTFLTGEVNENNFINGSIEWNAMELGGAGGGNALQVDEYVVTGLKIVNNFKFFEERSEDNGKN